MKENIVKNGVISFAPDDESTNILGTVTSNYEFNAAKYRNIAVANRKSHNYAVNQLIKESGLEYTPEIFKLMSLVINEKFSIRKMSIVKVDIALFKLANNVSI